MPGAQGSAKKKTSSKCYLILTLYADCVMLLVGNYLHVRYVVYFSPAWGFFWGFCLAWGFFFGPAGASSVQPEPSFVHHGAFSVQLRAVNLQPGASSFQTWASLFSSRLPPPWLVLLLPRLGLFSIQTVACVQSGASFFQPEASSIQCWAASVHHVASSTQSGVSSVPSLAFSFHPWASFVHHRASSHPDWGFLHPAWWFFLSSFVHPMTTSVQSGASSVQPGALRCEMSQK